MYSMVTVVRNMQISLIVVNINNVVGCQNIKLYIFNMNKFICQLYLNKAGKTPKFHSFQYYSTLTSQRKVCQRMFKICYKCTYFTCQQYNAQYFSRPRLQQYVKLRTSRCTSWIQKRQRSKRSNFQHPLNHTKKAREFPESIYLCFIYYAKAFDYVDHNRLWKILQEMGIPDHLT